MLLGFPTHDVIWGASLASAQESADPNFAIENLQSNDPADTARFTASTVNIQIDLSGGNVTVVGIALINTSFTAGTFESQAGSIGSLTFPSRTQAGKQRNGFLDLRGLPNRTDDHFELDLTSGSSAPELGRICLITAWQAPEVLVEGAGAPPVFGARRPGQVEQMTRLGTTHRFVSPAHAPRRLTIETLTDTAAAILRQLAEENLELNRGFLLVPNEDVNDAWFAQCEMVDTEHQQTQPDDVNEITPMTMTLLELSMGAPPALT